MKILQNCPTSLVPSPLALRTVSPPRGEQPPAPSRREGALRAVLRTLQVPSPLLHFVQHLPTPWGVAAAAKGYRLLKPLF